MGPSSRAAFLAVALVAGACSRVDGGSVATAEIHGVRLGMAPRDVRSRFDGSALGTWQSSAGEDLVMEFEPRAGARESVQHARFEFHGGMLVALRVQLGQDDPVARGDTLEVGRMAVVSREPKDNGVVELLLVSRDCPNHREEVARLVAQSIARR